MQEFDLRHVVSIVEAALSKQDLKTAEQMLWPALDQFPNVGALWFFAGNIMYLKEQNQPALLMFKRAAELDVNYKVYPNIAAVYRKTNQVEECRRVLEKVLDHEPDNSSALCNMGASWVNEGNPQAGIAMLRKAIKAGDSKASWNLGILLLEAGQYAEGFDLYHRGIGQERAPKIYAQDPKDEPGLLEAKYGRSGKTLLLYGEQGIGDELMFTCCLYQALEDFGHVILDCHPRLESIFRHTFRDAKNLTIYPNRKTARPEWFPSHRVNYKAPIGDLAMLYRRSSQAYLKAARHPFYRLPGEALEQAAGIRKALEQRAKGRPIVGLGTRGGVISTNRHYRGLGGEHIERLFQETDAFFLVLDYEDMSAYVEHLLAKYPERLAWFPAATHAWDFHHTGALIRATDFTLTTCQSVAHLSASIDHPTAVLVPSRPAWRYFGDIAEWGDRWFLYPSPKVQMIRQEETDGEPNWTSAIDRAVERVKALR